MSNEETQPLEATAIAPSKEELTAKLNQLKATATQQYALKNYAAAAETYSEAAEVQDEVNGEMATQNAELLYQYGRCLYHLGVCKSDVLGGKVAQQEEPQRKKRKVAKDESEMPAQGSVSATTIDAPAPAPIAHSNGAAAASKPFFQITGDENWSDSEEEDAEEAEAEGDEEDDDDLAIAYEILDTARVLYHRKLEALKEESVAAPATKHDQELRALRERLADTHDLQAEIKLENEQFADAVNDAQQTLAYRLELYPQESGMIAEAHYKLSIALDFASMPTQTESGEADPNALSEEKRADMRKQAAEEMEKAILSCQARVKKEETLIATQTGIELEKTKRSIADAKDLIQDMKNRLVDLRNPAADVKTELEADNSLKGLLGEMLGKSKVEQMQTLAAATANANDLSGLIKQKKKPKQELVPHASEDKGKRKLEDDDDAAAAAADDSSKKVKFKL